MTKDIIADLSGKSALRTAKAEGLIEVRQSITSSETWKAWLDRYGDAPPDAPMR